MGVAHPEKPEVIHIFAKAETEADDLSLADNAKEAAVVSLEAERPEQNELLNLKHPQAILSDESHSVSSDLTALDRDTS